MFFEPVQKITPVREAEGGCDFFPLQIGVSKHFLGLQQQAGIYRIRRFHPVNSHATSIQFIRGYSQLFAIVSHGVMLAKFPFQNSAENHIRFFRFCHAGCQIGKQILELRCVAHCIQQGCKRGIYTYFICSRFVYFTLFFQKGDVFLYFVYAARRCQSQLVKTSEYTEFYVIAPFYRQQLEIVFGEIYRNALDIACFKQLGIVTFARCNHQQCVVRQHIPVHIDMVGQTPLLDKGDYIEIMSVHFHHAFILMGIVVVEIKHDNIPRRNGIFPDFVFMLFYDFIVHLDIFLFFTNLGISCVNNELFGVHSALRRFYIFKYTTFGADKLQQTMIKTDKIAILLFMIFPFISLNALSQSLVIGNVQDAFLGTPLPEAKVQLLLAADSTVVIDSIPLRIKRRQDGTISQAQFSVKMEKESRSYLFRATLRGYEDGYQPIAIDGENDGAWLLDEPLTLRRMSQIDLDELTVTATKVKMYYKGDTIVYDASAFQLPDGSMLDDLIRQMPGVTMNDAGEIFVNNRKINELQLGSRAFMGGKSKVMLENLPYFTVKDIKVYEQDTEINRALDAQIEKKRFVMDVSLKPEYQVGYIGNVEAAGGTQQRWLGRGFLLGFTPRTRYTLTANSNNVNESRHIGGQDHWTPDAMPRSMLTTHGVAGEIDYQSADKNLQERLFVDFASTRNEGETTTRHELFLPGNPQQTTFRNSLAKEKRLSTNNRFQYTKPGGFMFKSEAVANYKSYNGNALALSEQYFDTLILRNRNGGLNDGNVWNTNLSAQIIPKLRNIGSIGQNFYFSTHFDYSSEESRQTQGYHVEDFVGRQSAKTYNSDDYSYNELVVRPALHYALLGGKNSADIHIEPSYSREKRHDWLYHPDTLLIPSDMELLQSITDRGNSYDSELQTYTGQIKLHFSRKQKLRPTKNVPIGGDANLIELFLNITPARERLHYVRGTLDTLATRNSLRIEPRLDIHFYINKDLQHHVYVMLHHYEYNAPLVNQLDFRDDATPLIVNLGNPDLKKISVTAIQAEYKDIRSNRHSCNLFASYGYLHNAVERSVSFNPVTGVYTYRPENVKGTYDIKARAQLFATLDAAEHWTAENTLDGNFIHWLDHAMLAGATTSRVNAVNSLTLHDGAYIQYHKGALNIRATGDVKWRHGEGAMHDFETLDAVDFNYGLSARYTIPLLKTTLSTDGKIYSRRGYGNATLNGDDFVLNAAVSQPFLNGRLIARIQAFDILHRLSSTTYEVNGQGRIETHYRSLPHYVMAHIVYHFTKNPVKK